MSTTVPVPTCSSLLIALGLTVCWYVRFKKRSTPARALVALVLLALLPVTTRAERLPSRVFTTADGLANNVVTRIVLDSRGYQWFCTREGLSLFDGSRFVSYGTQDGLPSGEVNDILETRDGIYWMATGRGLVRFDPMGVRRDAHGAPERAGGHRPMFSTVQSADARTLAVRVLFEDPAGQVWVGTLDGLYRLRAGPTDPSIVRVDMEPSEVLSLASKAGGGLWVGTSGGLFLLHGDGRIEHYTTREGLPAMFVTSLLNDDRGQLWVGTHRGGVAVIAPNTRHGKLDVLRTFTEADGLASSWVNAIAQTTDGAIWIATEGGVSRMRQDPTTCRQRPCADVITAGLSSQGISIAEDGRRNLWVGTMTGAGHLLTVGFALFSSNEGIPAASSLIETPDGVVLTMTAGGTQDGAARFDGQRFVPIRLPIRLTDTSWGWNQVWLSGRQGEWWIGTRAGALRLRGVADMGQLHLARERRLFSTADGLAASVVFRLFQDSRGDVWIGTVGEGKLNGLSRWERSSDTLHHYRTNEGLPDLHRHFVTAFAEDRSGALWVAFNSNGGLSRIRGGTIDRFSGDDIAQVGTVRNLLVGADGTLWGATTRGGLLRVANPSADRPILSRLTMAEGLSSNEVGAIVDDASGRIYAGTARGIDKVDPVEKRVFRYGAADGIPVGEVFAAIRDRHGDLWFGFNGGMIRFTPGEERQRPVPLVLIDALSVDNQQRTVSALGQADLGHLELAPGRTALQISYLAPGFASMDGVRYQIKLEGIDQDWSPLSDQRTVNYANIGPGDYRFAVRAVTGEGVVSSNVAGFEFRVLTPVWKRWWFVSTAFAVCAAASYAFYRHRIARILRVADMRARIARDLHDDIGANLTRIAVLAEVARRQVSVTPAADAPLSSIANVARQSMTSMGEIVWAVNPDREKVENLTQRMREYAEEVFASDDVELTFAVPDTLKFVRLGTDVRRDLYLVFKEAANNAARHSGCTRFNVEICRTRRALTMTIADNGRGFDPATADGNGLSNMCRRLTLLGGRFELGSNPGRGTTIKLEIPLGWRTRLFG